jgi:predicted PhzF superfamily epimerase YddE/YHI9
VKLRIYQVDAFASRLFEGNPAAVCPLEGWLDDAVLLAGRAVLFLEGSIEICA